jgi:hypothetical protein
MKIKVKVHGHQHYVEHVGEAIAWGQCAEYFGDINNRQPLQVPCVLLKTENSVKLIPLQTELTHIEVEVLHDTEDK